MDLRFLRITSSILYKTKRRPQIILNGDWLVNSGFETGMLVAVSFSNGEAIFRLLNQEINDIKLLCQMKKEGIRLLRVGSCLSKGKTRPIITVKGLWLEDFGFSIGSFIVVKEEYGSIKMNVLDIHAFESTFS